MWINAVRASAFGPLRNQTLELAPGLNVVQGPNEAGKSSWFAAAYAGLAGRRRTRGAGTVAQREFAKRHKPWSGSQWKAGVVVTLDDGSVLAIEHDLARGESTIVDESRRAVHVADLERRRGIELTTESTLDGTRLLGLNRNSARATVFTGQADILRVLEDAGELQDLLERAATSAGADETAEGALTWLGERRSEWVGASAVGNRPLRARRRALEEAQDLAGTRRDDLIALVKVTAARQQLSALLQQADEDLALADRAMRWQAIYDLRARISSAEDLAATVPTSAYGDSPVDEGKVRAATTVLGAFDGGSDVPPLPNGPSASDLQTEIDGLPEPPVGDLAPRPEVHAAHQKLSEARAALVTHLSTTPSAGSDGVQTQLSPDDLRALADVLEATSPVVDPALSAQLVLLQEEAEDATLAHSTAQAAYEATIALNDEKLRAHGAAVEAHARATAEFESARAARTARLEASRAASDQQASTAKRRSSLLIAAGVVLLLVGIGIAVAAVVPGIAIAVVGALLALVGVFGGRASASSVTPSTEWGATETPPAQPVPPRLDEVRAPTAPVPNPRLMSIQVEIKAQEIAVVQHRERVASARAVLLASSLAPDPATLRQIARAIDDADAAAERLRAHDARAKALRSARDESARALAHTLGLEPPSEVTDEVVSNELRAFDAYTAACTERAATAQLAGRKPDLVDAQERRRQLELAHAAAAAEREAQAMAVRTFASDLELGTAASTIEAAGQLRDWLGLQDGARVAQAERLEVGARLDQLLEGRDLAEWRTDLAALEESAGPEPDVIPADVAQFRVESVERHDQLISRAGQLDGQRSQLTQRLASVAEAVEQEAEAERALTQVTMLASCIDAAAEQLNLAKERAHANIAPALESRMRPWIPRVTNGRYLDVAVDPSDLTMQVTEASGEVRQADLLSHGTTEQLFLLLRLTLSEVLSGAVETAPLVLDDVTTQSDQQRTVAIMELLQEISADRQVVVFTQEQEVVAWAEGHLDGRRDRLIALQAS